MIRRVGLLVLLPLGVVLVTSAAFYLPPVVIPERSSTTLWTHRSPLSQLDVGLFAPDWVRIARALRPAVVHISTWDVPRDDGTPVLLGLGSGAIVNGDGYIVTAEHMVRGAMSVSVTLADGRDMPATVIDADAALDVALLNINAGGLPVIPLGDSSHLAVGEPVMAIGNPFGLDQTATVGIISGLERPLGLHPGGRFIQTDARINRGNSGGPLINRRGQAIGINTVVLTYEGSDTGIGFAIPSHVVEATLTRLAATARTGGRRHR